MSPSLRLLKRPRLTLIGGSLAVILFEALANVVLWVVAAILFMPDQNKRRVMSLALVAWTLGLRHGLDVDHISAIDNATRHLISLNKFPLLVGTFFSLGHSTIVLLVTIAISVSTDIADNLGGVSTVGGVIGVSVSASFLLLVAIMNSVVLWRNLRRKKQLKRQREASRDGPAAVEPPNEADTFGSLGCISKLAKPLFKVVDSSWKMYPIGVLFGLGFDTSSEIALLAVSALAKNDSDTPGIANSEILILPCLFTAGMSLIDALDSIFMLWCYAAPKLYPCGEGDKWAIFKRNRREGNCASHGAEQRTALPDDALRVTDSDVAEVTTSNPQQCDTSKDSRSVSILCGREGLASNAVAAEALGKSLGDGHNHLDEPSPSTDPQASPGIERLQTLKASTLSDLSIVLTIVSIAVAFFVSLVEFMGLAAQECRSCSDDAENDAGLSGRWWRFWIAINNESGYLGAGVVGIMVIIALGWFGWTCLQKRQRREQIKRGSLEHV